MLKQRSLFPSFGKTSPTGRSYNAYINRRPVIGQTISQRLVSEDTNGRLASSASPSKFNYYTMGYEKFLSTEHFYQDNWCVHNKVNRLNLPFTHGYVDSYGWYAMFLFCRITPANWAYPDVSYVESAHNVRLGMVGDELRAEAYWDMRPKFEGEVSMLNFIYELKDFREIAKLLSSTGNKNPLIALSKALTGKKSSQRVVTSNISEVFSTPTKSLAEAHLINAFAIQPLISDLTAIFKQLSQMVEDAERKFGETGAGNTRRWSRQLDPVASFSGDNQSSTIMYRFGSSLQSTYTMSAKQRYTYTPRTKLNAFCTYWGLVPNAEAIWNALPFSFLVDYFLSVGKSLNRMRTDPNVTTYSLSSLTESVLTKYTTGQHLSTAPTRNTGHMGIVLDGKYFESIQYDNPQLIDGHECTFYKRDLDVQPYYGPALPKIKVPKTSQLINMAALARCFF